VEAQEIRGTGIVFIVLPISSVSGAGVLLCKQYLQACNRKPVKADELDLAWASKTCPASARSMTESWSGMMP